MENTPAQLQAQLQVARQLLSNEPLKTRVQAQAILVIAEQNQYLLEVADATRLVGLTYELIGDYKIAADMFEKAKKNYEVLGNRNSVASCLQDLGNVCDAQLEYLKAQRYYLQSLTIKKEEKNIRGQISSYNGLANVYARQANHPKAIASFGKALQLAKRLKNDDLIAAVSSAFGGYFMITKEMAEANISKAEKLLRSAMSIYETKGLSLPLVGLLHNLGRLQLNMQQYRQATVSFERSLKLAQSFQLKQDEQSAIISLGEVQFRLGKFTQAESTMAKALALSGNDKKSEVRPLIFKRLAEIYNATGRHQLAYDFFKKFHAQHDLTLRTENIRQLNRYQAKFNVEQKEREKEVFKLKNVDLKNALRHLDDEKKKSDKLLRNILPDEIADDLKRDGHSPVKLLEDVTVMFSDIKGFTKLSEKYPPQELVAELDFCFKHFDAIVEKYGLEKIKTIGDAYMCACGLPKPTRGHALRTVKAALEMRAFVNKRKKERERAQQFAFQLRIGIHSGPVIAGIIGDKKFAYDIWGDTVNTAARMEQNSEAGEVNVSQQTFQKIKRQYDCLYRGKLPAKNKGEIDMYFVVKPKL